MKKLLIFLLFLLPLTAYAASPEAEQQAIEDHRRLTQRQKQKQQEADKKKKSQQTKELREKYSFKKLREELEELARRDNMQIGVTYDNSGNKETGERIDTLTYSQNNLFGINDTFYISRSSSDFDKKRDKLGGNDAVNANLTIPFLDVNALSLSYTKASYFFWTPDVTTGSRIQISGVTEAKTINLSRTFHESEKYKLNAYAAISDNDNRLYIDHSKITSGSRRASLLTIGATNTFNFKNASLVLVPSYNKSLNIMHSQKDSNNLASTDPHAEFQTFALNGNYMHSFEIDETPAYYNLVFNAQTSDKALYGADQISAGGLYSVRGFKEGAISGDSGYNLRNEFTYNFGQKLASIFSTSKESFFLQQLNKLSITPFYDYGYVRSKGGQQSGRLSGTGTRLDFTGSKYTASITFSWALSKSQYLAQNIHENSAIFFSLSGQFEL